MDNGTSVGDSVGQRKRQAEYYREYRKRALLYCENVVHEKEIQYILFRRHVNFSYDQND
jgi:hypothetical protein